MRPITVAAVFLSLATQAPAAFAQLRASEKASVSQTVDGTTFTVDYSRPRARGRTSLFGTRVHWGETWTPGANQATTLDVSRDVTIEGAAVPKGKYSVWIIIERGPWEMVLDRDARLFHTQRPKKREGQIRFPVRREKRPFMEALTWWFPEITASGATLAMQWDTVYVPLRFGVRPSYSSAVAPEVAKRIVGTYRVHLEPEPRASDPTLATAGEARANDVQFTIREQANELHAVMDPPLFAGEESTRNWILLPSKGGWFTLGQLLNGEVAELVEFLQVQFDTAGSRAQGFEVRTRTDVLAGKANRIR